MKKLAIDCLLIVLAALFLSPLAFGQCACGTDCKCPAGVCPNCPTQSVAADGHWETRCNGTSCSRVWVQAASSDPTFPVARMGGQAALPTPRVTVPQQQALAFPVAVMPTARPLGYRLQRLFHRIRFGRCP